MTFLRCLKSTALTAQQTLRTNLLTGWLGLGLTFVLLAACTQANIATATAITPSSPSGTPAPLVSPKDGMTLLYVPAGEFLMGSSDADTAAYPDEKPQHKVTLDAFWIDQTEVTNLMYAKCIRAGVCQPVFGKDAPSSITYLEDLQNRNLPAAGILWDSARTYCAWAGRRLPSEAEWEKAARGTNGRLYPWGNAPPNSRLLNYNRETGATTAVGSYPLGASPYGALDMAGNLWEWAADWYSNSCYAVAPSLNPPGPAPQIFHSCRGGSWNNTDAWVRAAKRGSDDPSMCDSLTGIRCASSASGSTN